MTTQPTADRTPPAGTLPDGKVHMIPGGPDHREVTRRFDLPTVALCGKVWWPDWEADEDPDAGYEDRCQECADRRALIEAEWAADDAARHTCRDSAGTVVPCRHP